MSCPCASENDYDYDRCKELIENMNNPMRAWVLWLREEKYKRLTRPAKITCLISEKQCICLECPESFVELDIGCGCVAGRCSCKVCNDPEIYDCVEICDCGCTRSSKGNYVYKQSRVDNGCGCEQCSNQPCICGLPFPDCDAESENEDCPGCEFCTMNGFSGCDDKN